MSDIGEPTLDEVLYEGNYEEWHQRMRVGLKNMTSDTWLRPDSPTTETLSEVASLIRSLTSPAMMRRVPDEYRDHSGKLLQSLRSLATPFRLLDLPPEIRDIIYAMALPGHHTIFSIWEPADKAPPLLRVSSQVRQEASRTFYSSTTIVIALHPGLQGSGTLHIAESRIRNWAKEVVGIHTKYLRSAVVWISTRSTVKIEFKGGCLKLLLKSVEHYGGPFQRLTECGSRLLKEVEDKYELDLKAGSLEKHNMIVDLLAKWTFWDLLSMELKNV